MGAHPLSEQCSATSKATGQRCQRHVIGGGVCWVHGGAAPQVARAREARIIAAEAAREAPVSMADAADVLTSAMNDAHALLQRIKENIANGRVTDGDLRALGEWVDRAARISKLVVDAGIEERQVRLAERHGQLLAGVVIRILDGLLKAQHLNQAGREFANTLAAQEFRAIEAGESRG